MTSQDTPPAIDRWQLLDDARTLSAALIASDEQAMTAIEPCRTAVNDALARLGARDRAGDAPRWDEAEPALEALLTLVGDEHRHARLLASAALALTVLLEDAVLAEQADIEARADALVVERMAVRAAVLPVQ